MSGLINYVKKVFKNYPDKSTPITAENLNYLDNAIYDLDQAAGQINASLSDIQERVSKMGMKVLKSGTITGTQTISLGTTLDPSKYTVKLNSSGYLYRAPDGAVSWGYGYGQGAYVSARTNTSVTIVVSSNLIASYEIIQIAD